MRLSEIRGELIAQHQALRASIEKARALVARSRKGEDVGDHLHTALVQIVDSVRAHNRREEELMKDVLPALDAWGEARTELMLEEHVAEHEDLFGTLMTTSRRTDLAESAATIEALFEKMLAHMEREEKGFLGPELLNDQPMKTDSFGG